MAIYGQCKKILVILYKYPTNNKMDNTQVIDVYHLE